MAGESGVNAPERPGRKSREQIEAELLDRARFAYSLQQQGNLAEAERIYREILAVDENHYHATHLLGVVAAQVRAFEPAAELISRAVSINPHDAVAHSNLGNVLMELERYADALASHGRAIELDPNYASAYSNQANVLREIGRFDEALAACDRAIALQPAYAEAWSNRAGALTELARFDEAIASYDRAISLNPHFLDARLNRAQLKLALGDLEQGWPDYELRLIKPGATAMASFDHPPWRGDADLRGRSILIHAEQGLGDLIQFSRYIRKLNERGARVFFAPWTRILRLMRSLDADCELVDVNDGLPQTDFHCPLLSLPLAFGTTLETIPGECPYLRAEPDRVAHWASRIGDAGFRIGICWQGKSGKVDLDRSFPLAALAGVARLPGVRLISLHQGDGERQLATLPTDMRIEVLGDQFDAGEDGFLDAAAVIAHCDLVISSDTSIAHLAGALGKPCWIALKRVPEWRWMLDRRDSPWYPMARLFRQSAPGNWSGVFDEMEAELRMLLATHPQQEE